MRWQDKRTRFSSVVAAGSGLLVLVLLLALAWVGLSRVEAGGGEESRRVLENNLNRAVLTCYAVEGFYPPSLDYLTEGYGLVVDGEKFAVHYSVFADNIMPQISVALLDAEP